MSKLRRRVRWLTHDNVRRACSILLIIQAYLTTPIVWSGAFFGHLKDNLRIHRGMSIEHRQNFIKWYLFFCNEKKKKDR